MNKGLSPETLDLCTAAVFHDMHSAFPSGRQFNEFSVSLWQIILNDLQHLKHGVIHNKL